MNILRYACGVALALTGAAPFFFATTDRVEAEEVYAIEIAGETLDLPGAYIWNRDLRRDGRVSSINLFMELPDLSPLPEADGSEAALGEGFGRVISVNLTDLEFDGTPAELLREGDQRGQWNAEIVDMDRDGIHLLYGTITDPNRWYVLVEDGAVDLLMSCLTDDEVPYPSCTAHATAWDAVAVVMVFDLQRLPHAAELRDRVVARLSSFRRPEIISQ
ncbi:MAG: hypothetical protein RLO50_00750 [Azospirillaceae bacterium]